MLLVNFGGPRTLREVSFFLEDLLSDQDVIQTPLPRWLHRWLFSRIARKRAKKVINDYRKIGGGSPIYADTEKLAKLLTSEKKVHTFHRYLRMTHGAFKQASFLDQEEEIVVFPLFPQFSYVTTGSVARWFSENLPQEVTSKMRWIASYATHPAYIAAFIKLIAEFLEKNTLEPSHTLLIFSAHGLPQKYVDQGDPYVKECEGSFDAIKKAFPECTSLLSYQSQFGKALWTKPATKEIVENILEYCGSCSHVVFIPLTFTSDHIETLFEVEEEYLPPCREAGLQAYRCPALNHHPDWIKAIGQIIQDSSTTLTEDLIRR